jgi:prephenate dehydrogenase
VRVAIVGLGVVGGSLARALTRRGHEVVGLDRPAALRRARAARAVSGTAASLAEAARDADVLVLAAPPRTNQALLRQVARLRADGLVVTDVGSVKGPIVREARRLGLRHFVGGHPIAGNEGSGFGASTAALFENRTWVLAAGAAPRALRVARALVRAAGARPVVMEAALHDRAFAFLSHVPQVASWAILAAAEGDEAARAARRLAGPGFTDMTRLARSPRGLWREILSQNRREVDRALVALRRALSRASRP